MCAVFFNGEVKNFDEKQTRGAPTATLKKKRKKKMFKLPGWGV